MNVISASKVGKSWLSVLLAFSVAYGLRWLGFLCETGKVLIVDNELHKPTIGHRLKLVAEALGIEDDWRRRIDLMPLRGESVNIGQLSHRLSKVKPGQYKLIIGDAFYRFIPEGTSENDNAQIMAMYNRIDAIVAKLGSAWVNIHHSSKGDQSQKAVTDVGSGAGSQSRAADSHLVLRPHEDDQCAVLDAAVRSFAPVDPRVLRWEFPLWSIDEAGDPSRLADPRVRRTAETRDADRREIVQVVGRQTPPATKTSLIDLVSFGSTRFRKAFASLVADGTLVAGEGEGHRGQKYQVWMLNPKADPVDPVDPFASDFD